MQFVEVFVASPSYHGQDTLTYSATMPVRVGDIVSVPLQRKTALGLVARVSSKKPSFATKAIISSNSLPEIPPVLLSLLTWLREYYPAPLGILTQLLLPKAMPARPLEVRPLPKPYTTPTPPLTKDQRTAIANIQGPGLHILHGETGTGKTRVYIELAKKALSEGKSSIILTPEIGLTSQLSAHFTAVFGARVIVVHSKLTDATRARLWQYTLEQPEPLIIIGPRSALFYPLKHVGLIIIDEAHETAYKQDQAPYYHTTPVAGKLASLHNAPLVLGSATPLVSDYFIATAKNRPILRMTQTATGDSTPNVATKIVDLRDRKHFNKSQYISDELIVAIKNTLQKNEQSLLFLNRRGTARVVFCEQCGWQAECPHCDLPLIYHGDAHRMRCHSCNFSASAVTSCPECRHTSIVFKVIGTKAIVEEATRLFPEARIMRFDTDNKKTERIEEHYDALASGNVDILIGTQTIAKGLDLPRLGLVGVLVADTGLYFPDFSAKERTFQLLVQVLGRVGRGHRDGQVVVQTYTPDSPLLQAALNKKWSEFYNAELTERRTFTFPPFCYLLKLTCKRASSSAAARAANDLANELRSRGDPIRIEGPAPSFHEKSQGKFAWQIIVKTKERTRLTQIVQALPSGWSYDIDPMNLL